ncbi:MAG TPA: hypothetical protein VFY85_11555 [Gemmatimonadaceae bacterium]|nr:hypothetical protein [Gemmatimonadaceae bacterium]
MTSLQPHDLRGTSDAAAAPGRAAWRRITAAIERGAPVPYSIHIHHGGADISYAHAGDPLADATAMAQALGLTDGPIGGGETVRWCTSNAEWEATGDLWSVWAHLPQPTDPNEGIGDAP